MAKTRQVTFENDNINYIIDYFAAKQISQKKEILSAIKLTELAKYDETAVEERYNKAYIMCRYMKPDTQDVIAILLAPACKKGVLQYRHFIDRFSKSRAKHIHNWVTTGYQEATTTEKLTGTDAIDYNIMLRVCDKMFDGILYTMSKSHVTNSSILINTYRFAKKAHFGVRRASGEPYLCHPVSVAAILADIGVESSVVSAALLHDVVEDTDYKHEDIAAMCGEQVARYVDAVTAVNKQYENSHIRSEYSSDKPEIDRKSFEKLVNAVESDRSMIFALYIKAADRIHNLSTLDVMKSTKKHNKTDETELDYLPLFERFHLNYFVNIIKDLTWQTVNPVKYLHFKEKYEDMYRKNERFINDTVDIIKHGLESKANEYCEQIFDCAGFDYTLDIRKYRPREVYFWLRTAKGSESIFSSMINKHIMPVCDIDIILDAKDSRSSISSFSTAFIKTFQETVTPTSRVITDFTTDKYHRFIVSVEDNYDNIIRLCFCMRKDFDLYRFGSDSELPFDETPSLDGGEDKIYIKLKNGNIKELPVNSTALDVAFAIHERVGLSAKSAKINGEEASIYNIVHDGDKVEVFADTKKENGEEVFFIPHARIAWLEHVATKNAKHIIVKELENLYGDADPASTHKASDKVVSDISNRFILELNYDSQEDSDK